MVITGRFLNFMGLLQVLKIGDVLSSEIPPSKQLRIIRLNGLTKPLFLGRLRPDRLTIYFFGPRGRDPLNLYFAEPEI